MTPRPRRLEMSHVILVAFMSGLPLPALADDARSGKWRETGYAEDQTGKRTPCIAGFCGVLGPMPPGLDEVCASAQDIEGSAREHLAQSAMLFRSLFHNCKDTANGGISCDEGDSTQSISRQDSTHFEYSFTTEGAGHRMTRVWHFEWLGDDCSGAKVAIKRRQ